VGHEELAAGELTGGRGDGSAWAGGAGSRALSVLSEVSVLSLVEVGPVAVSSAVWANAGTTGKVAGRKRSAASRERGFMRRRGIRALSRLPR